MQIGDLVTTETCQRVGVIIAMTKSNSSSQNYGYLHTVHWFIDGHVGVYWIDELEAVCK